MKATIYQTTSYVTRSILHATEIASVDIDNEADEEELVRRHDGDLIEIDPNNPGEEHEQVRHDRQR